MKTVFSEAAKRDLDDLRAYLAPLSPSGLASVTAALLARIHSIPDNPNIGRRTPRDGVREVVEPKYGFVVPYCVKGEVIFVLRIYRSRRKPLDYQVLDLT